MQKIVIIGGGGFSREVLDIFEACNCAGQKYDVLGYIVDPEIGKPGTIVNDKPIIGGFEWFECHARDVQAICAVGAPETRQRLVQRAERLGVHFCCVVHPTAILTRHVTMAEGVIITAGCILTNQIQLGRHVQVNLDCTIGHDTVLEDFATLAPGVHVSGRVSLAEGCYVGTGTNIIERKNIGAWSIVGAGSVITADVPPNSTVVGVPGRVVKTRAEGWQL